MKCEQIGCDVDATARMYWPGAKPVVVCPMHHNLALALAQAMGFYLHVAMLDPDPEQDTGGTP